MFLEFIQNKTGLDIILKSIEQSPLIMEKINTYIKQPVIQYALFWIIILICYMISCDWDYYQSVSEIFVTFLFRVSLQLFAAYIILFHVAPRFKAKKNKIELVLSIVILLLALYAMHIGFKMFFLERNYPLTYVTCIERYDGFSFWDRGIKIREALFKGPVLFLTPAFLLLIFRYYQDQQELLKLSEQKTSAELTVLKNQLNPHFLFNTLNNVYSLAIKKSDKTPEVIGKLSDILDYTLYRCNEKFVSLEKEIKLIQNYLTLEKVRYGKRVAINFNTSINQDVKIAPLLLLTFIENAFKHGVSQEINQATINIDLTAQNDDIVFVINNTIPNVTNNKNSNKKESIGLKNVQKQLELLYPNVHQLKIKQTPDSYAVELKIKTV